MRSIVVKILNRVKKNKVFRWGFTTVEGGTIYRFKFPDTTSSYERMKKELTNPNNWDRYPGPHPEGRGSRNYTYVKIIPDFDCIKVHSLYFPDGTVFDSTIRDFRKITSEERAKQDG